MRYAGSPKGSQWRTDYAAAPEVSVVRGLGPFFFETLDEGPDGRCLFPAYGNDECT